LRAFRHRDFTLFWWGALISNTGTWLQNVTVPYVLWELTHNALWVGLSTFVQFIPAVLFGPAGGALADRRDRRQLLILTQSLMAIAALGLWICWVANIHSPAMILLLVGIAGTLGGLNSPSWQAFVPELVPREDLLSAITLNSLQFNAARALGPTAAGIVLATMGPGPAFLLNALSFGCVLGALALVRRRDVRRVVAATEKGITRQFRQALRYIHSMPGIETSITISAIIAFLGNPITQFTVVYTSDVYHVGNVAFGVLSAAMGIGAILAVPIVSGWDAVLARSTVVRYGLPAYGLACAVFGFSSSFWLGFVGLLLTGGFFLAVITATNTAVQVIVADRLRGRVMAARVMSFMLAYSVGGLVQGWAANRFGPRPTVTAAGLLLFGVAIVYGLQPGRLARLDDSADHE
jgi:MFS family permease